jgi:hypothetical protein
MTKDTIRNIRGWRKAAAAAGSLAVLAAAGVTATQAFAADPSPEGAAKPSIGVDQRGHQKAKSGLDVLSAALERVSPGGSVSVIRAEKTWRDVGRPYAMVTLKFTPAGATAGSEILLQYKAAVDGSKEAIEECDGSQHRCEVFSLPNGSAMQISDTPFRDKVTGDGTNRIASLYLDGTVVTLWAQVPTSESGKTLAPRPVLTRDELKDVLSQPGWADLKTVK